MSPWTTAHQASLSLTVSQSLPKFVSIELVMPSNHHGTYTVITKTSSIPYAEAWSDVHVPSPLPSQAGLSGCPVQPLPSGPLASYSLVPRSHGNNSKLGCSPESWKEVGWRWRRKGRALPGCTRRWLCEQRCPLVQRGRPVRGGREIPSRTRALVHVTGLHVLFCPPSSLRSGEPGHRGLTGVSR